MAGEKNRKEEGQASRMPEGSQEANREANGTRMQGASISPLEAAGAGQGDAPARQGSAVPISGRRPYMVTPGSQGQIPGQRAPIPGQAPGRMPVRGQAPGMPGHGAMPGQGANNIMQGLLKAASRPIGEKEIGEALETYKKYKSGTQAFRDRIVNCEEWWKNNHWDRFGTSSGNEDDPKPVSAWLFNSILNKHADYMDNYPAPAILPREKSDEKTAKLLSEVVPVILEANGFAKTYNVCSWDKPKTGTAIYGVLWNPSKQNGLGDIEITHVDLLSLVWEPGVEDLQKSRNVFTTRLVDQDILKEQYPELEGKALGAAEKSEYIYDVQIDTTDKVTVYDWYYKKQVKMAAGFKTVLHYCKFIEGYVLYASENDPGMAGKGWYDHGKYPFVIDVQFPEKGMPVGFGYLDVMVNPQEYVDKLDQIILKNANLNRPRYFASEGINVNLDEFTDTTKDIVHVNGAVDETKLKQIEVPRMSDSVFTQRDSKVNELKETSGNRDFSQGSTASGVTAASAIAALQEAGSKLSRDMIKTTYTAYEEIVILTIELIRQFYDLPRCYRITGETGEADYVELTNESLLPQSEPMMTGGTDSQLAVRTPVFDVKVAAQKASPYSRIATNELAKELFQMGVFNPQLADQAKAVVTMMDFDRRDEVLRMIAQNGDMYQKLQWMQGIIAQMAGLLGQIPGGERVLAAVQQSGMLGDMPMTDIDASGGSGIRTDSLGRPVNAEGGTAGKARERVSGLTEVQS